eukprot:34947-Pelagomonas_calceolata.AAC.4
MPLCKTRKLQNVKAHENGKKHKERAAAWQQAQKEKGAWQKRKNKGAEYIAPRHAGQAADPNLHTLLASTKQKLAAGEPCAWAFKTNEFSIAPFPSSQWEMVKC